MSDTFQTASEGLTSGTRLRVSTAFTPVLLRATITIDIEADDHLSAEQAKRSIAAHYDRLRLEHRDAVLVFKQRKPRVRRRACAPTVVVAPYVDD